MTTVTTMSCRCVAWRDFACPVGWSVWWLWLLAAVLVVDEIVLCGAGAEVADETAVEAAAEAGPAAVVVIGIVAGAGSGDEVLGLVNSVVATADVSVAAGSVFAFVFASVAAFVVVGLAVVGYVFVFLAVVAVVVEVWAVSIATTVSRRHQCRSRHYPNGASLQRCSSLQARCSDRTRYPLQCELGHLHSIGRNSAFQ